MKISKDTFFSVASDLKMPQEQIEAFWNGLEKHDGALKSTPFAKYLFYFGALIIISAMTWFMNLGWEVFGGGGIFLISTAYAFFFWLIGHLLWDRKGLRIPSGLFITIAVCMVPLAIYGLQTYFKNWLNEQTTNYQDFYHWINGKWLPMEVGTILAGCLALRFYPFPFLTAPIFCAAWFLTMDIANFIFGKGLDWEPTCWMTMAFGLLLIGIGFVIDHKKKEDYGFWSYLFGTLSFWIGLNCLVWERGELALFVFLIVNLIMMCFAILVRRNVLMIFGAIGVFSYLGHLAYSLFEDSVLFPFVLSLIGLAIIYLGILYQRNAEWIERKLVEKLPAGLQVFLENKK